MTAPSNPPPAGRTSHRRTGCLIAFVLVIGAIVVALAWLYLGSEAPQAAQLATGTPSPDTQAYVVAPDESQMRVTVNSALGVVQGGYQMGSGTVELQPVDGGWIVLTNLTFDARTIDVGNAVANAALRRALEVETYPAGVFVAQSTEPLSDLEQDQDVALAGQLELHGTVQPYTIPTHVTFEGDKLTLATSLTVHAGDFGVSIPGIIGSDKLDTDLIVVAYHTDSPVTPVATPAGQ